MVEQRTKDALKDLEKKCEENRRLAEGLGFERVVLKLDKEIQFAQVAVAGRIFEEARQEPNPDRRRQLAEEAIRILADQPTGQEAKQQLTEAIDEFMRTGMVPPLPQTPSQPQPPQAPPLQPMPPRPGPPPAPAGPPRPTLPPRPQPPIPQQPNQPTAADIERHVNDKRAEADDLADQGKFDDARSLLRDLRQLVVTANREDLREKVDNKIKDVEAKEAASKAAGDDLQKWLDSSPMFSLTENLKGALASIRVPRETSRTIEEMKEFFKRAKDSVTAESIKDRVMKRTMEKEKQLREKLGDVDHVLVDNILEGEKEPEKNNETEWTIYFLKILLTFEKEIYNLKFKSEEHAKQ
jgi:hypothetical protein